MITVVTDFNLRPHNTFRVDASCAKWIEFTEASDVPAVVCQLASERYICIGGGSNMLFVDDFDGAILHSRILDMNVQMLDDGKVLIRAGSGLEMDSLIRHCCESGLWGLENLSGIPGEVGASAVQNVGAYGVEASDVISAVECYDTVEKRFVTFGRDELDYGYRWSMFKSPEYRNRYIITYVEYLLSTIPNPKVGYGSLRNYLPDEIKSPLHVRDAIIKVRNEKLPLVDEIGSAGSFFKNPVVSEESFRRIQEVFAGDGGDVESIPHFNVVGGIKVPAAWLIDRSGLKSAKSGGAAVWHKQPLVIVNATGTATPSDIVNLENHIIHTVKQHFGVVLEPEVEHII